MSEPREGSDDSDLSLTVRQLVFAIILGILVMYFSATTTIYFQSKPAERSLVQLIYPFDSGPSAEKLHRQAVKRFQKERYEEAVQFFARSLEKDSDNAKGLFLMASAHAKLGDFDRALQQINILEKSGVDLARVPIKKAYWLLGMGEFNDARDAAQNYVNHSSPPNQNKFYGYMILYTISRLQGETDASREVRSEIKSLELNSDKWPMLLFSQLRNDLDEETLEYENLGRETEYRAWKAMLAWASGKEALARENRNWVLRVGDSSVYEYDMMLATRSSELFSAN